MSTIDPGYEERAEESNKEPQAKQNSLRRRILWSLALLVPLAIIYVWGIATSPPKEFLPDTYIEIPRGTLAQTAIFLKEHSIIRSETIFLFTIQRAGKEKGIQSGRFYFENPIAVFEVAKRVMNAEYGIKQLKITFPEGITTREMATILNRELPVFDGDAFRLLTREKEGYLFPDTYFFHINATSSEIISKMEETFHLRTDEMNLEAQKMHRDWKKVVIIASLLEEEATTEEDRKLVSGIIWKRLEINMPLQIDATLGYITGKGSLELTRNDLRNDSPYNTYTHKGLPPTPISNPGTDALMAALYPTTSPYLYYLSDKSGTIHYAKTFEEHKLNKARYLR